MAGQLDSGQIDIPCPGCGHKNTKTVGWLKTHNDLTCGGCGNVIDIEASGFRKGMREIDAELAKLNKSLNKTFRIKL